MNINPTILIMGRQNVGKSTLFNLLIKSKKAITDSTPGVTRDLVYGNLTIGNNIYKLVDSGGITFEKDETNKLVKSKTFGAYINADIIVFLVEVNNLLPIEKEYLNLLRKAKKKIILAVNKCDTPDKDNFINEFYQFGTKEIIPISAAHNRNIDVLLKKISSEIGSSDNTKNITKENSEIIKISILGKPNVGKSSLLNKIVGKERSIVSNIPGTTRDVVDEEYIFADKHFLFLDTAGIRKKTKINEGIEYYSVNRALKSISIADIIILVIDSLEDISEQDKKISDQIIKKGKGLIIILNKWDLMKNKNISIKEKIDKLHFKFPFLKYVQVLPVSSKTGEGINRLLKELIKIYNEVFKKVETSDFNTFLHNIVRQYSPSSKKGILKIFYGTQIKSVPTRFIIFVNNKNKLSNNYKNYIINKIRDNYGYSGIPIEIIFKDKNKNKLKK